MPGQGDIRALEGTRVTIHATANRDIQQAEIDLDGSGRRAVAMQAAGKTATGALTLAMDADDPTKPQHESYQILFTDAKGHSNHRPIRYRIEVVRDLPPGGEVHRARSKRRCRWRRTGGWRSASGPRTPTSACGGWRSARNTTAAACRSRRCLAELAPEKAWPGQFQKTYSFQPAALGLKAGDRVTYWAEAEDNKEPTANRSETGQRLITVTASDGAAPRRGRQPHPAQGRPNARAT